MKLALFFIGVLTTFSFGLDIATVRKEYKEAIQSQSKEKIVALFKKLEKITKKDDKVLVAYKGAVSALIAKKQKDNNKRKTIFKEGISLLEYAVKSKPESIEIRFIRLAIQQNIPKFLKYNKEKEEDKAFVLDKVKTMKSSHLKQYISDYILQSKHFSEEEKNVVLQQ